MILLSNMSFQPEVDSDYDDMPELIEAKQEMDEKQEMEEKQEMDYDDMPELVSDDEMTGILTMDDMLIQNIPIDPIYIHNIEYDLPALVDSDSD